MTQDRWDKLIDYIQQHSKSLLYEEITIDMKRMDNYRWRVLFGREVIDIVLGSFGLQVGDEIHRIELRQDPRKIHRDVMMYNDRTDRWFRWNEGYSMRGHGAGLYSAAKYGMGIDLGSPGATTVDEYTMNKKRDYLEREVGKEYLDQFMSTNEGTSNKPEQSRAEELKASRPARLARLWKDKYMRTGVKPTCLQLAT